MYAICTRKLKIKRDQIHPRFGWTLNNVLEHQCEWNNLEFYFIFYDLQFSWKITYQDVLNQMLVKFGQGLLKILLYS